ncbi:MAG: molybdopterin dehydrogenase [candidate division Zixibacteria bacterium CG_4_9_14_3_um_filter_46_8]|nr:MAG: molybdopterin dehydrogenase [candidate division Zixibacteria bacterium CG_4_9_14_3_um_filter_46_8]
MIPQIEYYLEADLDQALKRLASSRKVFPLAGGTDLIINLRKYPNPFDNIAVLDIKGLGFNNIYEHEDYIAIGAATTHTQIEQSDLIRAKLPVLAKAASVIGSRQIRNRGTIGGNIVNASPCADTVPALLLYNAQLVIKSASEGRVISISDFIIEPYKTVLRENELIAEIRVYPASENAGWSYFKLGRRGAVNISRMTLACALTIGGDGKICEVRISAGSVFPITSRIPRLEKELMGQHCSGKLFGDAGDFVAKQMMEVSGNRWSTPYKEPVVRNLVGEVLSEAHSRCKI